VVYGRAAKCCRRCFSLFNIVRVDGPGLRSGKESELDFLSDSGSPIGSFVLYHTPKLGIPVEMLQFHLILLLKQTILAVYHNFY